MLVVLAALSLALPPRAEIDCEALARGWLAAHGGAAEGATVPDVLRDRFAHLRLGAFALAFPPESFSFWGEAYADALVGLLDVQLAWIDQAAPGDPARAEQEQRVATLRKWLASQGKRLRKLEPAAGSDLVAALEPEAEVRAALEELAAYFDAGGPLAPPAAEDAAGVANAGAAAAAGAPARKPAELVFLPGREDFVPFVYVLGLLDEPWRGSYWTPDAARWTHCEWAHRRLIALEFATPAFERDWEQSISMTQKNKRGLVEHVVQLGARQIFEDMGVPALFAVALANNLTIDVYGEVDTRNDGDTAAREIGEVSIFVPGALSDGVLPAANADSRWRKEKGKEYFLPPLRQGQKDGSKDARSKWQKKTHFTIDGDKGGKHTVAGPFFGPGEDAPPDDFLADYAEFLRAYRSGFLHWLREHGAGEDDADLSRRAYGDFLRRVAGGAPLGDALKAVYADPLSDGKASETTLEGRFLDWLSKGK